MKNIQKREALRQKERKGFYDLWYTPDETVKAYFQKKVVKGQSNPPREAKHRESRKRTEVYARYEVGKIYFAPDEVDIHVQGERNSYPLIDMSLSEILDHDENILNLEEKERAKSLIFYNCTKSDEELVT